MSLVCEDLATKEELQELKDKINSIFGQQTGGGEIDVLDQGSLTGTSIQEQLDLADEAIQDIKLVDGGGSEISIVDDLALIGLIDGTNKLVKTKGQGVTKTLSFLTETFKGAAKKLIQNKSVGKVATKAAKVSGASMAILASLVNIVTTLGLNIATVQTLAFRIDQNEKAILQMNRDYTNLINLWSKQNQQSTSELLKAQTLINKQQSQISGITDDLANANNINAKQDQLIEELTLKINELQEQNQQLIQKITEFEGEITEEVEELQAVTTELNTKFETAKTEIQQLTEANQKLKDEVKQLQDANKKSEKEIKDLKITINKYLQEITLLKQEIATNKDLTDSKLKNLEARLILAEDALQKGSGGGGFPITAQEQVANTQTKTLELMNKLTSNPVNDSQLQITPLELLSNNPFPNLFDSLLPGIEFTSMEITPQQMQQITSTVQTAIGDKFDDLKLNQVPGDITKIKNNTEPEKIKQKVEEGICEQTKPDKCLDKKVTQPLKEHITNTTNNLNITLLGFPDLFGDECKEVLEIVKDLKTKIYNEGNNAILEKKILAGIYATTLHNGVLLSNGIETTGVLANSNLWNSLELKDFCDNEIKSQAWVESIFKNTDTNLSKQKKQIYELNNFYVIGASLPEAWATRVGNDRPQMIVQFKPKNPNYTPKSSRWTMSIPHPNTEITKEKLIDLIPSYNKGDFQGLLQLKDNSKLIVYAGSIEEAASFIDAILAKNVINPKMIDAIPKVKLGTVTAGFKEVEVTPEIAKYFSKGQKDTLPDWIVYKK